MRPDDVLEALASARDAITVKRVYGEPYERDGVTVIPAASVGGGGGGGSGEKEASGGDTGGGTGFGLGARPVGAFVISGSDVRWVPARDVTQMAKLAILMAGAVAALGMLLGRGD